MISDGALLELFLICFLGFQTISRFGVDPIQFLRYDSDINTVNISLFVKVVGQSLQVDLHLMMLP